MKSKTIEENNGNVSAVEKLNDDYFIVELLTYKNCINKFVAIYLLCIDQFYHLITLQSFGDLGTVNEG